MTEVSISIEAIFAILIGSVGVIITLAAGYAALRERIITSEVKIENIEKEVDEIKQLIYEFMKAMKVTPRANYEQPRDHIE